MPSNAPNPAPNSMDVATQALLASQAFPLDPKKLPYGGVIDPAQMQGGQFQGGQLQGANMALALATSAPGLQMNHTVYTSPKMNSTHAFRAVSPSVAPTPNDQGSGAVPVGAAVSANVQNPLPSELMQDIASLRAINQYRSTASRSAPSGTNVDVVN